MRVSEKQIIMDSYKTVYSAYNHGLGEYDTVREMGLLMTNLGLQKEKFEVENTFISEENNLSTTEIEMYQMIFDDFINYKVYINFDLKNIKQYFSNLKYSMTEEEVKCNISRINYLESKR